jgi:hypothetical protein
LSHYRLGNTSASTRVPDVRAPETGAAITEMGNG